MSNRKPNKNSTEAYKRSHELRVDHWGKILFAMRLLGISCSSEAIAKKSGLRYDQTYRRMSELISDGCVYVSGKGLTSSGRPCALYSLTEHGRQKQETNAITTSQKEQKEEAAFIQPELFQ